MNPRTLFAAATMACTLLLTVTSAQAQFDHSVYGVADFSYGRFEPSGLYREHRFNSNSLSASFVGGNLKQGFDGGWTPAITLETFVRFQDLKFGRRESDPLLSRNAFVSLGSNYGNLRIGRLQTYLFDTTNRFNALGNAIAVSPAIRHLFASGTLEGVQGDFYWNRAIGYTSPNWEGVTMNAMFGKRSQELDGHFAGGNLVYSQGLLALALSTQRVRVDDGIHDPTDETAWQLGATYNFGIARAFGLYTTTNDRGLEVRSRIASAGVAVPLGPGTVLVQTAFTKASGLAVDRRHTSTSGGYVYPYDSLTDIYAVGMNDRVVGQTRGITYAAGVRLRF